MELIAWHLTKKNKPNVLHQTSSRKHHHPYRQHVSRTTSNWSQTSRKNHATPTPIRRTKSSGINRKYVTLDDPDVRFLAKHDPGLFLQRYSPPVLIDEIQSATELLPYIKMHVDKSKQKGDFWLTGSQVFHLMKNVSESLAGRVGIINLLGLSNAEIY